MLTWRPLFRPANIARRAIQGQRRSIHATIPRAQSQPRPLGVLAKIRFRADGKPRSRWMGAFVGTLVITNVLTLVSMYDLIEESENALGVLAGIVYMHKLDLEYGTVNLDDPIETYTYFRRMYQAFSQLSDDEMDPLFKHFSRLLDSSEPSDAEAQARLHEITRKATEQTHMTLQELSHDSIIASANYVLLVMLEAFALMIELIQDAEDDDDTDVKYPFQLIKGRSKKDPGSSAKDYEVLG